MKNRVAFVQLLSDKMLIVVTMLVAIFFILGSTASFAGTLSYELEDKRAIFKLIFDDGYSNVSALDSGERIVVLFDSEEPIIFERLDFIEGAINSVWLEREGSRNKLLFTFEKGMKVQPKVTKQSKSLTIDFDLPTIAAPDLKISVPGVGAYLRMFFGLGVVIAIILLSYGGMRILTKNNVVTDIPGTGRLLGRINVDIKHRLAFYELGETLYILGLTDSGINLVDKISDPVEINIIKSGFSKKKSFSSYMKYFGKKQEIAESLEDIKENIEEKVSSLRRK